LSVKAVDADIRKTLAMVDVDDSSLQAESRPSQLAWSEVWPCDLDLWPFNPKIISLVWYPKVDHFGNIRFGVIVRTDRHTDTETHRQTPLNALLPRLPSAWVMNQGIYSRSDYNDYSTILSRVWALLLLILILLNIGPRVFAHSQLLNQTQCIEILVACTKVQRLCDNFVFFLVLFLWVSFLCWQIHSFIHSFYTRISYLSKLLPESGWPWFVLRNWWTSVRRRLWEG